MAVRRGKLIGGPLCGGVLPAASRSTFIWVRWEEPLHGGGRPRAFEKPAKTRHLYRSVRVIGRDELFVFAGHTHRRCECGGYNEIAEGERDPKCQICAQPLKQLGAPA